jgi:hypothetical protein
LNTLSVPDTIDSSGDDCAMAIAPADEAGSIAPCRESATGFLPEIEKGVTRPPEPTPSRKVAKILLAS